MVLLQTTISAEGTFVAAIFVVTFAAVTVVSSSRVLCNGLASVGFLIVLYFYCPDSGYGGRDFGPPGGPPHFGGDPYYDSYGGPYGPGRGGPPPNRRGERRRRDEGPPGVSLVRTLNLFASLSENLSLILSELSNLMADFCLPETFNAAGEKCRE